MESIYDKIVESMNTRNTNKMQLIEGVTLMAAATEKMSSSIDKLSDCIKLLSTILENKS